MDAAINILQWILFVFIIMAFILSTKFRNNKGLLAIQLYVILNLIDNSITKIILPALGIELTVRIASLIINLFSLIEFILMYYFLYFKIENIRLKKISGVCFLLYIGFCIFIWTFFKNGIFHASPDLFGIESLFIIVPCLFYIYEIAKSKFEKELKSDPYFIITCGILGYFSLQVPLEFSWHSLSNLFPNSDPTINFLNILMFSILIFSILRAYLCLETRKY